MEIVLALLYVVIHAAAVIQPAEGEVPCTNGTVQVVGGPNQYEGRVEFCANGGWAQVCGGGPAWGKIPARVVCSQLSTSTSSTANVTGDYYGVDNLQVNSVNIRQAVCRPTGTFSDCVNMEIQNQGCSGGLLASVACPVNCDGRSVRLISDPQSSTEGLLETCLINGRISFWTGVCHENFTLAAATVVCRQLGLLRSDSSVTISRSPSKHWRTYDTLRCNGSESNISECQRVRYKEGARCNSVVVNCQGGVDGTVAVTGSDFSTSTASSVTTGDSPTSDQEPSLPSPESNSDMLIVITGAVCGIVILLLLIAVTMLTLILVTKSRNNRRRLKDAVPPTVNGSQQQSNTLDSRTPVYNPNYSRTPTGQPPSSQSNTLKKLTLDATSTSVYAEPRNTTIQTVPLPIPTESYNTSYPVNNPQRDSGIILPQLDTFLPPPETNPADLDVHIYAEPDEPGLNCQLGLQHEYAELEACVDRYRNSNKAPPQHHLGGPLPYEVPMVVGGSYVNVIDQELPSNSTGTHSAIPTEGSVECQTVTSPTVGTCDHQYATPGLPS